MQTAQARLDLTLAALADPTRRAILRRLSRGEARVTDLAQPFAISLNSVSKHIRMLERADLVRRRRVGREHVLSLDLRPLDAVAAWIESERALWTARLDALDVLLQAEDAARTKSAAHAKNAKKRRRRWCTSRIASPPRRNGCSTPGSRP